MSGKVTLLLDSIEIVDSIPGSDLQTARRLHETLRDLRNTVDDPEWNVNLHRIASGRELRNMFTELAERTAKTGRHPLIHFECHGSKNGISLASGESITWEDLAPYFRRINRSTRNNLVVVMAACEGYYSIRCMFGSITEGAAIRVVIGPDQRVSAGAIEDSMKSFYSSVVLSSDIDQAIASARRIEPTICVYKAEDGFIAAYLQFLQIETEAAKSKPKQVEDLVSKMKATPGLANIPHPHKVVRQALKMASPEHMLAHNKQNFFMSDDFPELAQQVEHITLDYIRSKASKI